MDGDVLRLQGEHPLQGAAEALKGVPGQAGDQVHVDGVKAHLPGQGVGVQDVPGGVFPSDGGKHLVLQGLGIDGDALHPLAA